MEKNEIAVIPNHIHCVIRAELGRHFFVSETPDFNDVHTWLEELVAALNMKVMEGPMSFYNTRYGLEGWSAAVLIETSSITLHAFDKPDGSCVLELDVYTCGEFDHSVVRDFLKRVDVMEYAWKTFDRSDMSLRITDRGHEVLQ